LWCVRLEIRGDFGAFHVPLAVATLGGMFSDKYAFSQLLDLIHKEQFQRFVRRYRGEYKVKSFSCWDQFLCMAFGQLAYRDSLSDIEICLRSRQPQLYHLGIRGRVSHSTLADANHRRDWRIYYELAQALIPRARLLYAQDALAVELEQTVYALDSTTIDLCLKLFPWARFQRTKAAVKLHTLLDLRGSIPVFIGISDGKMADVLMLDELLLEPGAFYVIDRGYVDFQRLHRFVLAAAFFVTRSKSNLQFRRLQSHPVEAGTGVRSDQTVRLKHLKSRANYPDPLRRIHYVDAIENKSLVFLTNNFDLPAAVIAALYKSRWQVELFFKWIKQNLRIKHFFGNSQNAVKTQVWIAVTVYVLVAILKKELGLERSLSSILQILSVNVFSKEPLVELLTEVDFQKPECDMPNQLIFNY
jgi:hypothetical protein